MRVLNTLTVAVSGLAVGEVMARSPRPGRRITYSPGHAVSGNDDSESPNTPVVGSPEIPGSAIRRRPDDRREVDNALFMFATEINGAANFAVAAEDVPPNVGSGEQSGAETKPTGAATAVPDDKTTATTKSGEQTTGGPGDKPSPSKDTTSPTEQHSDPTPVKSDNTTPTPSVDNTITKETPTAGQGTGGGGSGNTKSEPSPTASQETGGEGNNKPPTESGKPTGTSDTGKEPTTTNDVPSTPNGGPTGGGGGEDTPTNTNKPPTTPSGTDGGEDTPTNTKKPPTSPSGTDGGEDTPTNTYKPPTSPSGTGGGATNSPGPTGGEGTNSPKPPSGTGGGPTNSPGPTGGEGTNSPKPPSGTGGEGPTNSPKPPSGTGGEGPTNSPKPPSGTGGGPTNGPTGGEGPTNSPKPPSGTGGEGPTNSPKPPSGTGGGPTNGPTGGEGPTNSPKPPSGTGGEGPTNSPKPPSGTGGGPTNSPGPTGGEGPTNSPKPPGPTGSGEGPTNSPKPPGPTGTGEGPTTPQGPNPTGATSVPQGPSRVPLEQSGVSPTVTNGNGLQQSTAGNTPTNVGPVASISNIPALSQINTFPTTRPIPTLNGDDDRPSSAIPGSNGLGLGAQGSTQQMLTVQDALTTTYVGADGKTTVQTLMGTVVVPITETINPTVQPTNPDLVTITSTDYTITSPTHGIIPLTLRETLNINGTDVVKTITTQVAVTVVPGQRPTDGSLQGSASTRVRIPSFYAWGGMAAASVLGLAIPYLLM